MTNYWLFLFIPISYIIGNINFSVIISKSVLKKDVRNLGSGNPGTTNMLRNFGFKWGLVILVLDAIKGAIPALLGMLCFTSSHLAMYSCGLAAIVGHIFPVAYKFKGGKGVATLLGVFFVANPFISSMVAVLCFVYWWIFEYGALTSFIFISCVVVWAAYYHTDNNPFEVCWLLFAFYFLTWYTHRTNIFRLLTGRENKASLFNKRQKQKLDEKKKRWLEEAKGTK